MSTIAALAEQLGVSNQEAENLIRFATPANLAEALSGGRWQRAKHLQLISNALVDMAMGRVERLVISMPPRHGKSLLASHWFPVWYLNLFPRNKVVLASYAAEFAEQWGRAVRNTIQEHAGTLNVRLSNDSQAAGNWETTLKGGMMSVGVGGPLSGRGANVLIIDDPIKNSDEANSLTIREKIDEWWRSTAFTRLEPGAGVVIIMTRWNEDDIVGRVTQRSEKWREIVLPAIATEDNDPIGRSTGEALWPERYDIAKLEEIAEEVGTYWFSAMYQQAPAPREGGYFSREWFEMIEKLPTDSHIKWVRFWDLAGTDGAVRSDADYTVGTLIGYDRNSKEFFVADIQRFRKAPGDVEREIIRTAARDGHFVSIWIEQEPGSAGKYTINQFKRLLPDYKVKPFSSTGPKESYADVASARAEQRKIKVLVSPRWNLSFFTELEQYPRGAHDDQVDSLSKGIAVLIRRPSWGVVTEGAVAA